MADDVIPLKQGNNPPVVFKWPEGLDLAGHSFELVVSWPGDTRVYGAGTGLAVTTEGAGPTLRWVVTWSPPLADTRAFPPGRVARYAIEYSSGGIQRSGDGWLHVEESPNRD